MMGATSARIERRRERCWKQVHQLILNSRDTTEKRAQREVSFLQQQAETLRLHFESSPWLADPEYAENYARKYTARILENSKEILERWRKFLANRSLVAYLEENEPQLLLWAGFNVRALAIASRLDVEPPSAPPPKRKLSVEEWRERKTRWIKIKAEDKKEEMRARLDALKEAREFLAQYELEEDARTALENEIAQEIFATGGEGGKDDGTFKAL